MSDIYDEQAVDAAYPDITAFIKKHGPDVSTHMMICSLVFMALDGGISKQVLQAAIGCHYDNLAKTRKEHEGKLG